MTDEQKMTALKSEIAEITKVLTDEIKAHRKMHREWEVMIEKDGERIEKKKELLLKKKKALEDLEGINGEGDRRFDEYRDNYG